MKSKTDKKSIVTKKIVGKDLFEAILNNEKNFDARINDFKIEKGQKIIFKEWDPTKKKYTGREVEKEVSFVLKTKDFEGKFWNTQDINKKGFIILGLKGKESDYLSGWQRAKADLENFQKRVERERRDYVKFANVSLITEFIELKDNFDQAVASLPKEIQDNPWVQGFQFIENQFRKILEDNGVTEIITKEGDEFNPEIHEALHKEDKKESRDSANKVKTKEQKNKVKKVLKKGYKLHDRIIRPTIVAI
jgi:molecular chaperone GrpE